jgi:hypothetical protein
VHQQPIHLDLTTTGDVHPSSLDEVYPAMMGKKGVDMPYESKPWCHGEPLKNAEIASVCVDDQSPKSGIRGFESILISNLRL